MYCNCNCGRDSNTLIESILETSYSIKNNRTVQDILLHAFTEMGELAQEVQISIGDSYKTAGADGIIDEALDVISCMVDIIYNHSPDFDEDCMIEHIQPKLDKWERTQKHKD